MKQLYLCLLVCVSALECLQFPCCVHLGKECITDSVCCEGRCLNGVCEHESTTTELPRIPCGIIFCNPGEDCIYPLIMCAEGATCIQPEPVCIPSFNIS